MFVLRKILIAFGISALLLVGVVVYVFVIPSSYEPEYSFNDVELADLSSGPAGEIWFPGFNARQASDLLNGGVEAVREPVVGTLYLPPEASAENPVPAFVILHGSGGDFTNRSIHLAKKLAAVGIAGFAVDTFRSRKLAEDDDYYERLKKASIYTQMADAFNALKTLQEHPMIRGDLIGVTGFSIGATSAQYTAFEQLAEPMLEENGPRFAAHVMFYTGCNLDFEDFRLSGAPWLVMLGSADESTSASHCETLLAKARSAGVSAELKVYDGAGHGWDQPYELQFFPDAFVTRDCVAYMTSDGDVIEKGSGWSYENGLTLMLAFRTCATKGYSQGRHDAANIQSVQDTLTFLDVVWGGSWSERLTSEILLIGIPEDKS
ncbi:MAG: dienelactone hydrolase family protein [Woeseiaceae bacterium]